jgi:hypothetical protein
MAYRSNIDLSSLNKINVDVPYELSSFYNKKFWTQKFTSSSKLNTTYDFNNNDTSTKDFKLIDFNSRCGKSGTWP